MLLTEYEMDIEIFKNELIRCLGCKVKPCAKGCPLGVSPCDFIAAAKTEDYAKAAEIIAAVNPLPLTCGLICPDHFCQKVCVRAKAGGAIKIPELQAEVIKRGTVPALLLPQSNGKKAAVVGGGPAGLGAVFELIMSGWQVDLYEKGSCLGGAVRLIPEYRLPESAFSKEIKRLTENERVAVHLNTEITDFDKLQQDYDGVVLALGEPEQRMLGIEGEEFTVSYKTYLSVPESFRGKKAAVSGGGEVALDCALSLKKNGFETVEMFVRRRKQDMRIMARDFAELDAQGVIIRDLTSITHIKKTGNLHHLFAVKNELNAEGKAVTVPGSDFELAGYDVVITALGSYFPKEKFPQGFIVAGDMSGNCGTAVQAIASGKAAARKLINGEPV